MIASPRKTYPPAGRLPALGQVANTYFSLVGINFLLAGLSFATTLVVANLLGREGFGELSYAIAIGGYCLCLAYCGLEQTLVRDLVQAPERFADTLSASLALRAGMLGLALAGTLLYNALAPAEDRLGWAGLLIVLTEGIRALALAEAYDAWRESRRNALYLLAERCVYFASVWGVILAFGDSLSLGAIAIFLFASMLLGLAMQYRWALPRAGLRLDRAVLERAAALLRCNLWVWSAVLATLSFGTLSKIVLRRVDGSAELGGYSVAWQVVPLGLILISQAARLGNPYMARLAASGLTRTERARFLLRYGAIATLAGCAVGLPAILFPAAILRVFRPEYASAEGALRILGLYVILLGAGQASVQYLIACRRDRTYASVVILTGLLGMVLYSVLIPRWSSQGAALAVVIAHGTAIACFVGAAARQLARTGAQPTVPEKS